MRLFYQILFFKTVKSKVIITLLEAVRLSLLISQRLLYNSSKSIKENSVDRVCIVMVIIKHVSVHRVCHWAIIFLRETIAKKQDPSNNINLDDFWDRFGREKTI